METETWLKLSTKVKNDVENRPKLNTNKKMLLAKDEHKKLIEFSAKVPTCIICHPFPLKIIMQSTVHYNDVYLY